MAESAANFELLERERELEALRRAWRETQAGRGSAWLICAEAGGGKTRLLREATRAGPVRWGTSEPVSPPEPYLAVMQALRGFRPAARRAESVAGAVEHLERLAAAGPIAVVFDDLHFADEGTIAVFVRLAGLCAARRWLILGALRPGEGSAALRLAATELVGQGRARRLDLPPLSRGGVAGLIAAVRGAAPAEAEIDTLFADSGGNPWFAQALARGAGAISAAHDRILLRLDLLEQAIPGGRALLSALAPAGEPAPHAVVAALAGGDGPAVRGALRALRDAGVLRERDGAWQFRHELLRRSLFEDMLDADRREAHRRLAEALEGHGSAAILAMHYAAAGDARAAGWALRAAWDARAVDAHVESFAQLERALAFPLEPEARRTALRAAARVAWYLGRCEDCLRLAEDGLRIPGGEPERLARLHLDAADCARLTGKIQVALSHVARAERVLSGRPPSEPLVRLRTAGVWETVARMQPAETAAVDALRLADALANREAGIAYAFEARCYLGVARLDAGDPEGFVPFDALFARGAAREEFKREVVPQALNAHAAAVRSLFHAEAERFRRWLFAAIDRHQLSWETRAEPYFALELVQRGVFAEARARLAAMSAPAPRTPDRAVWICARALYEVRAGSPERARALLAAEQPAAFASAALLDLARLDLAALTAGDAADSGAAIYAQAERRRFARLAGSAAVALARAGEGAPERPAWLTKASPLAVWWEWAAGLERRDAALLRAVAARLEEGECAYEAALARRDAGDLPQAYAALRALGAGPLREQVARALRAAGEPIPRGPRAGAAQAALTDTERAVCRLVARGATNAAVAAALNIGVRTVEAHLSRVYQKTGQQGRAPLAAWWTEAERAGSG